MRPRRARARGGLSAGAPVLAALDEELRARLDQLEVRPIIEYVAGRLRLTGDHSRVVFELEHGNLRRTELGHVQVGNLELERVAAVPYMARRPPVEYDPREETR